MPVAADGKFLLLFDFFPAETDYGYTGHFEVVQTPPKVNRFSISHKTLRAGGQKKFFVHIPGGISMSKKGWSFLAFKRTTGEQTASKYAKKSLIAAKRTFRAERVSRFFDGRFVEGAGPGHTALALGITIRGSGASESDKNSNNQCFLDQAGV